MKRMMKKLVEAKSTTQDAYDMYNLSVLFKCYEWHKEQQPTTADPSIQHCQYSEKISPEMVHQLEEDLKLGNYYDDVAYCQNSSTQQVCLLIYDLSYADDLFIHSYPMCFYYRISIVVSSDV